MRTLSFRFTVFLITLLICSTILVQQANAKRNPSAPRSWLDVQVVSFDGKSITLRLALKVQGNHVNGTLRVWGEIFSSQDQGEASPSDNDGLGITFRTTVTVEVGRFVSDVTYSSESNITTFQYSARFASTYSSRGNILGFLNFPFDEHILKPVYLTADFNANIDEHMRIPTLPSQNYEGMYQVRKLLMEGNEYKYELTLEIKHSESFFWMALFLTWGIFFLLLLLTIFLHLSIIPRKRTEEKSDLTITILVAVVFFIPTFEFTLQSLKSPLQIVFSDFLFFILMGWNVALLIVILLRRKKIRRRRRQADYLLIPERKTDLR